MKKLIISSTMLIIILILNVYDLSTHKSYAQNNPLTVGYSYDEKIVNGMRYGIWYVPNAEPKVINLSKERLEIELLKKQILEKKK